MKHRVSLFMLAASALVSVPAFSAPVFMLQFGSFESRDEAQTRLNELKTKHTGVLAPMDLSIREVNLPPDNLTVYRTQAGPLNTRADAQSVCSQLASNGDECYVVETAMVTPASAPTTQVAQATPPAGLSPMPTPAPVAAAASTTAPLAVPSVPMSAVPARDPQSVAMLNSVSTAPKPAMAAASSAGATPTVSPSLQQAMDVAAAEQNSGVSAAPTPPGAKAEGSFWSRLNPFSSQTPAPRPALAAAPAVKPTPAPSLEMAAASTPPMPALDADKPMIAQKAPAPMAAPVPMAVPAAPAPVAPAPVAPVPVAPVPAPQVIAQAAPVQLPPPPAPLRGMGAVPATAASAPMPVPPAPQVLSAAAPAAAPAPVIVPQSTGNVPAPLVVPPPQLNPTPFQTANASNVRVGEAQRVPLSQQTAGPRAQSVPMAPPSVSLSPSSTLGQKTLWAQIGQFPDEQAALAFWDQYRRSHPDFPVVRVRVIGNYQAMIRGRGESALRVGPFAKQGAIRTLCSTLPEMKQELRCGTVADMGIAAQINGAPKGFLAGSRYRR